MADIEIEEMGEDYTGDELQELTPLDNNTIYIEITGLKGIDRFIGLQDTPIYYDNGKFFKVQDNKIVYTDIEWSDIAGQIQDNESFIKEVERLIEENAKEYTIQSIDEAIFLHDHTLTTHQDIRNIIQDNYTTLDTKIDTTKSELDDTISNLTKTVQDNYTTLDTKIDTLENKVDTIKTTTDYAIDILAQKVDDNYTTLDTKIDTTKSELDFTISDLTKTVQDNYTTLDTKIDTTRSELDGTISDLENKVNNNYTTLDTKIDTTKSELDGTISDLTKTVQDNYATLDTKIDTTKSELDDTISNLENKVNNNYTTLDTKIDTTKSELDDTISNLTKTVQDNYTTLDTNKANKSTTLQGYGIKDAYTKSEVDAKVASLLRFKGSVNSYSDLPTENLVVGDTYNVLDTGANYAWTDTYKWDKLSETVDLSPYLTKEYAIETYDTIDNVNNKISTVQNEFNNTINSNYTTLDTKINTTKTELTNTINSNYTTLDTKIDTTKNTLETSINTKQDKLTATNGVTLENNIISGTKIVIRLWD